MPTYLFQLGHQPQISIAEIKAVLNAHGLIYGEEENLITYYKISMEVELPVAKIMSVLGGTVKILRLLKESENLEEDIFHYLDSLPDDGKLNFSLGGPNAGRFAINIKKSLKESGKSVRYIEPKNTATILHNNLVESATDITLIQKEIFITEAIQPIEDFVERDFGRPEADGKSGMLPPKLAKIMINLAEPKADDVILDPFCGSGTILTEALDMGFANLIASDHSPKAIEDSKKNTAWFLEKEKEKKQKNNVENVIARSEQSERRGNPLVRGTNNVRFLQLDARELGKKIAAESVNRIISEPFLGKPLTGRESRDRLEAEAEELRQLYIDSFRSFYKLLKPGGVIVFVIPRFRIGNDWVVIKCVNPIQKIGFKLLPFSPDNEPLIYSRPKQFVAREIWRFGK
ncbi:MAG: DNA methyltransferase [Patescibacteria group bacterium]